jgi:4-amino-4-deoxy-L-arabinose transferase-like glycosyltransferase
MIRLSAGARRSLLAGIGGALALVFLIAIRNAAVPEPLETLRATAQDEGVVAYAGSWHFPRGGPYILGFESPQGPAQLSIDGRVIARGEGEQTTRRVYPPGVVSVRFLAPEGARLLWHPPGRRGPLEYVPASSLSPAPPAQASFSSWAGASPLDGVVALAALLVIGAVVAYWARGPLRRADRRTAAWMGIVLVFALAIRLVELNAAGQTWDEDVNWSAGRNYVTNWLALDFSQASWRWNYEHPPVMKYLAGIGAQFADGYGPARAISAVLGALACALLVPIGARLFSRRVGVLAAGIAALTPHLIAHSKIVGHEAPTMLLWTAAIWAALAAHGGRTEAGRDAWRLPLQLALVGLLLGLAVSSRFVNGLLAPLLGLLLLLYAPRGARARTLWLGLAIIPAVALLTSWAIWPRLWEAPIANLVESWERLRNPHAPAPYLGDITNTPARHYFAVYLVATAPAGILAGAALWLARTARERELGSIALALWIVIPLLALLSPVRQDGVRYIMPSVMALAMAAAAGYEWAAAAVARRWGGRGRLLGALGALGLLGYLAVVCARVHPYYLNYYGEHVGGPARVAKARSFEIAWWGEGLHEAIAYINEHAAEGARVHKQCVLPSHLAWLRHDLWAREVRQADRAEWILVYTPSWRSCPVPSDAELVFEVSVRGAPLAHVYRR